MVRIAVQPLLERGLAREELKRWYGLAWPKLLVVVLWVQSAVCDNDYESSPSYTLLTWWV